MDLDRNESGRDDIGFLLFSGIADSQQLDTEDAIDSALIFKLLNTMNICSRRFYSTSFPGDQKCKNPKMKSLKLKIEKFWKSMLKFTHVGNKAGHFDQMNTINALPNLNDEQPSSIGF